MPNESDVRNDYQNSSVVSGLTSQLVHATENTLHQLSIIFLLLSVCLQCIYGFHVILKTNSEYFLTQI